jgi:hypothetical protein
MTDAGDTLLWKLQKLSELAHEAAQEILRRRPPTGWKPNREFQERPREGLHVQFSVSGSTYVGQRSVQGGWRDAIWGKNFTDADVTHWAHLLGSPEP